MYVIVYLLYSSCLAIPVTGLIPTLTNSNTVYNPRLKRIEQVLTQLISENRAQDKKTSALYISLHSQIETLKQDYSAIKQELTQVRTQLEKTGDKLLQAERRIDQLETNLADINGLKKNVTVLENGFQRMNSSFLTIDSLDGVKFEINSSVEHLNAEIQHLRISLNGSQEMRWSALQKKQQQNSIAISNLRWGKNANRQENVVAFEARIQRNIKLDAFNRIPFEEESLNAGGGYNNLTGEFTATVGGIYLLWANVVYTEESYTRIPVIVSLYQNQSIIANGYTPLVSMLHKYIQAEASTYVSVVADVRKGEIIWVASDIRIIYKAAVSSFGGVLIKKQFH